MIMFEIDSLIHQLTRFKRLCPSLCGRY